MTTDEATEQLARARDFLKKHPNAKLVMHPELWAELVAAVAPDIPNAAKEPGILRFQGIPIVVSPAVPRGWSGFYANGDPDYRLGTMPPIRPLRDDR